MYHNPAKVYFGVDQLSSLTQEIPRDKKVLVLYGQGSIKKNGIYDQVSEVLQDYAWDSFGGIEPNPTYETLMRAVQKVQLEGFEYLLAVGGGSVIDGTKFVAAAALDTGDPMDILRNHREVGKALPMGCVLTLPATGSETNIASVISHGTEKLLFFSPHVRPQFAILDPSFTLSLPPRQISNGVVDAFVHVLEQYLTYPVGAKVQDRFAEGLLLTLLEEGPMALKDPHDLAVRGNIMWASTWALNGMIGAGVPQDWTTHMIGHELTGLFGIDHARTLSIILPAVLVIRRAEKYEKLKQYGDRIFGAKDVDQAIARTKDFFESMGMPTSLKDVGLGVEDKDRLLTSLRAKEPLNFGERQDVDLDVCDHILKESLS